MKVLLRKYFHNESINPFFWLVKLFIDIKVSLRRLVILKAVYSVWEYGRDRTPLAFLMLSNNVRRISEVSHKVGLTCFGLSRVQQFHSFVPGNAKDLKEVFLVNFA